MAITFPLPHPHAPIPSTGREGERAGSGPTENIFGQVNFRKMHQKTTTTKREKKHENNNRKTFNLGLELKGACRERQQHIKRRKKEEIKTEGCGGVGGGE